MCVLLTTTDLTDVPRVLKADPTRRTYHAR